MPARPFSLLLKPASADCNLRCEYCFYLEKAALYGDAARHRMSEELLERIVSTYLATDQEVYAFGWQGGEPTLMGLDFYRTVVELQKRHGRPGSVVSNGLQTNGLLIDDRLAAHFARYRFLLGVSLDGPRECHDAYRHTPGGGASHVRAIDGIETLRRRGVSFNILTTVNACNVGRPVEIYRYLVDHGFLFHQYIPIVELDSAGTPLPFSITGPAWGRFLCSIFDQWVQDPQRVSVRQFDAVLTYLVDGSRPLCTMGTDCRQYLVVEHNGDVYPCDFFVDPGERLGNIMEKGWEEMLASPGYRAFGRRKTAPASCAGCAFKELCQGDCPRNRAPGSPDPRAQSVLCDGWKVFYAHALPRLRALARTLRRPGAVPA